MTWLRQLQEHFFEQSEIKKLIDWNDFGQYCNVPVKFAVTKGVNYVHMSKVNTANAVKIESFDSIKPNKKDSKKTVRSLFEWAKRILYRGSPYVQDIAKSIERGSKSLPPKYNTTDKIIKESLKTRLTSVTLRSLHQKTGDARLQRN